MFLGPFQISVMELFTKIIDFYHVRLTIPNLFSNNLVKLFLKVLTFELYLNFYFHEDDEPMIFFVHRFLSGKKFKFCRIIFIVKKKILVCVAIQIFAIQA